VKVLLADDDPARARELTRVFAKDDAIDLVRVTTGERLAEAVIRHRPDVVLVDMARPDRDALDGIRQVGLAEPRPVVLFVDQDDTAFMEDAISAGVCSYHVLDTPPPDVKPILRAAVALFRRHRTAEDGLRAAEARLRERETIDRAKSLLIKTRRMAEPDAYHWLRRQAMARGRRIVDLAAEIVREHEETKP
jgi:two-component system, response regulator / RNA-binding antiterminator